MQALILAAGFGTRMYPFTKDTPKALLDVNNKPIIEYIIDQLEKVNGLESVYILSNDLFYKAFSEWLDKLKDKCKLKIILLNNGAKSDSEKKGAVNDFKFSLDFMKKEDTFLLAADNLSDFDLQLLVDLSREGDSSSVMLRRVENLEQSKKFNQIFLDETNKITFYEEKPANSKSYIFSTACYYLKKEDLLRVKNHVFEKADNFGEIIGFLYKESCVRGVFHEGIWADIGSVEGLKEVEGLLKSKPL
jgi:glucose-1-phosphate thymidylyltransferase